MTARCALFVTPWLHEHGYFSQHFHGLSFLPIDPMIVRTKFKVRSFTRSWDNMGYPTHDKVGSLWLRPRSLFSEFLMGFVRMDPVNVPAKGWSPYSFTHSWDNRGYKAKKFLAVPGYSHTPYSQINHTGLPYRLFLSVHSFSAIFDWEFWIGNLQSRRREP